MCRVGGDVCVAEFEGAGEEVEGFGDGGGDGGVEAPFWIGRGGDGAVQHAPFAVDDHGVPVVVGAVGCGVEVEVFTWRFQVAADHVGVDADGAAHLVDEDRDFVAAAAFALNDAAGVNCPVEVFVPGYPLAGPGEDGAQALDVASMGAADVALGEGGGSDHGREGGDESRGFVDAGKAGVADLKRIHDWVTVGAFVSLGCLVELVNGTDDWMVEHLTSIGTFLPLHWSRGV